jgi:hypothetical protein
MQTRRPYGPADWSSPNPGAEDRGLLKSSIAGHSIRRDIIERPANRSSEKFELPADADTASR